MLAAKRAITGPGIVGSRRVGQLQFQPDIATVASSAHRVHKSASCSLSVRNSCAAIFQDPFAAKLPAPPSQLRPPANFSVPDLMGGLHDEPQLRDLLIQCEGV